MAETNILVTDRHEWAGFRGGKRGRDGGCIPSILPSYLEILFVRRVDYVMDGWIGYLSCGDMVLNRW